MSGVDPTSSGASPLETQHPEAYAAARELILAGVPLFVAPPNTTTIEGGFVLPLRWQTATPTMDVLNRWQPGWALCAVMGHTLDLIDVDPRNGGDEGVAAMDALDLWPTRVAVATTPQGGTHYFVPALGAASLNWSSREGKTSGIAPGIDYKGGKLDGTGRGFAYIAPTVRKGGTYTWTNAPDHVEIAYEAGVYEPLRLHIERDRAVAPAPVITSDDPFDIPTRLFTVAQAKAYCNAPYEAFAAMRTPEDHGFNAVLNELAVVFGHFVPEFITKPQAAQRIYAAAVANRSVEFQGQAGVRATILSGLARGMAEPYKRAAGVDSPLPEDVTEDGLTPVQALRAEMLSYEDLLNMPNPKPLILGVLDLDTTSWLIGKSGSFKSFVALDMAACIATGREWHGHPVTQGPIIYVVAEGSAGVKLRAQAWVTKNVPITDALFLPRPVQVKDRAAWDVLVAVCAEIKPVMIVLDTQARVTVGLDENDNGDMGHYVYAADKLRHATGACVLTVHHLGRSGTNARGASAIDGAQDSELRIERQGTSRFITIHQDKQKDADDSEQISLALERIEGGFDPETGRDLSSLVVVSTSTSAVEIAMAEAKDEATRRVTALIGVLIDNFSIGEGGTRAEIRQIFLDDPIFAESSADVKKKAWQRAWGQLVDLNRIAEVQVLGTKRFKFIQIDGLDLLAPLP